jgi:hypothetical protein
MHPIFRRLTPAGQFQIGVSWTGRRYADARQEQVGRLGIAFRQQAPPVTQAFARLVASPGITIASLPDFYSYTAFSRLAPGDNANNFPPIRSCSPHPFWDAPMVIDCEFGSLCGIQRTGYKLQSST